jgi:AcrR family transcriptional regulator
MTKEESETTQLSRPARKRNPEESRKRILDAAQRAFALRGFAGARLRDIAQEAGVHHALVHHYYGDKRGLFQEVIKRGLARISSAGLESLTPLQNLERTVRSFVGVTFDFCANNRELLRIIEGAFRDRDSLAHEVTAESLGSFTAPLLKTLRDRMQLARDAKLMRSDISLDSILSMGFGAIVYRFVTADGLLVAMGMQSRNEIDIAAEREATVQFILAAMAPPK